MQLMHRKLFAKESAWLLNASVVTNFDIHCSRILRILLWFDTFLCSEEAHTPASCNMMKEWAKKCADDSEVWFDEFLRLLLIVVQTYNWIAANTKDCPQKNVCNCSLCAILIVICSAVFQLKRMMVALWWLVKNGMRILLRVGFNSYVADINSAGYAPSHGAVTTTISAATNTARPS